MVHVGLLPNHRFPGKNRKARLDIAKAHFGRTTAMVQVPWCGVRSSLTMREKVVNTSESFMSSTRSLDGCASREQKYDARAHFFFLWEIVILHVMHIRVKHSLQMPAFCFGIAIDVYFITTIHDDLMAVIDMYIRVHNDLV